MNFIGEYYFGCTGCKVLPVVKYGTVPYFLPLVEARPEMSSSASGGTLVSS